jgi:hypothetical protein
MALLRRNRLVRFSAQEPTFVELLEGECTTLCGPSDVCVHIQHSTSATSPLDG